MGRIDAPLEEIAGVGGGIEALGSSLAGLVGAARAAGAGRVSDPPATAAGLEALGACWTAAAQRLEDELVAFGVATQATAVAYRVADQSSMGGGGARAR